MLKLRVSNGDKILIGEDIVLEVKSTTEYKAELWFNAPKNVKINTIFKNIHNQFKIRNKI